MTDGMKGETCCDSVGGNVEGLGSIADDILRGMRVCHIGPLAYRRIGVTSHAI